MPHPAAVIASVVIQHGHSAMREAQTPESLRFNCTHDFTFSQHRAPELCTVNALQNRGRRESRVPNAPAASHAK